jgi:predicted transcriptional regulator
LTVFLLKALVGLFGPFVVAIFVMPWARRWEAARQAKAEAQARPVDLYQLRKQLSSYNYLP